MHRLDAIYARQSVDKADSISIESQIDRCKHEIDDTDYAIYHDRGYSGKNTDRPEFQRMMADVKHGKIRRIICYRLDRCSRSILDFMNLMELLEQYDVKFVSCSEKFDTSSPMGRAMLNICIVFAQLERETIQQRIYDSYHDRNVKGFYMGGRLPFGFQLETYQIDGKRTSRYAVNPEEASILKLIYGLYALPETSLADVCRELEVRGIYYPRKKDGQWTRTYIGRMLRNPIYVRADQSIYHYYKNSAVQIHGSEESFTAKNGCYLYSERAVSAAGSVIQYHLVPAPHEGIIDAEIWLKCVRKKRQASSSIRASKTRSSFLTGKLRCGACGRAAVISKTISKAEKEYRYIICSNPKCHELKCMHTGAVEGIIVDEISRLYTKITFYATDGRRHQLAYEINEKLSALKEQLCSITEKAILTTGVMFQRLCEHATALEKQISQAEHELYYILSDVSDCVDSESVNFPETLSYSQKCSITDLMIDHISVHANRITIHWRL